MRSLLVISCLLVFGCGSKRTAAPSDDGTGDPPPSSSGTVSCGTPAQGSRYAVCGKVTTSNPSQNGGTSLLGTVDSITLSATGSRYAVAGGFHASR